MRAPADVNIYSTLVACSRALTIERSELVSLLVTLMQQISQIISELVKIDHESMKNSSLLFRVLKLLNR